MSHEMGANEIEVPYLVGFVRTISDYYPLSEIMTSPMKWGASGIYILSRISIVSLFVPRIDHPHSAPLRNLEKIATPLVLLLKLFF